jgi:hypothetical protein
MKSISGSIALALCSPFRHSHNHHGIASQTSDQWVQRVVRANRKLVSRSQVDVSQRLSPAPGATR